jgi:putative colanic acid biosysnthesis UDP-glucose lipid carrier transferase
MSNQRTASATLFKLLLDLLALGAAAYLARFVNFADWTLPPSYLVAVALASLTLVAFVRYESTDVILRNKTVQEDLHTACVLAAKIFLCTVVLLFLTKTSAVFSRRWIATWFVLSAGAFWVSRLTVQRLLQYLRTRGLDTRRIVVAGTPNSLPQIAERTTLLREQGYDICAVFMLGDSTAQVASFKVPVLPADQFESWLSNNKVHQIWISLPLEEEPLLKATLERVKGTVADIIYLPDMFGYQLLNHSIRNMGGLPALNLSTSHMDGVNSLIKGLEDGIIAAAILVAISPLLLVIALGIKLGSPGPVLYKQTRKTLYGSDFVMYKFRSMPVDAEASSGAVWASKGDGRATAFGAFLRRTSLDELPQFWNVLKGDMSIVGPRPERPVFVDHFKDEIPGYMQKHLVKAGITGWAQVNGWRGSTDLTQRIEHDLYYIENWSLWFDLKIIVLTIFKGMVSKNSY